MLRSVLCAHARHVVYVVLLPRLYDYIYVMFMKYKQSHLTFALCEKIDLPMSLWSKFGSGVPFNENKEKHNKII